MKEEIKYHKELLNIIEEFKKPKSGKLISKEKAFHGKTAKFKSQQNDFSIDFSPSIFLKGGKDLEVGQYHKKIQIQFNEVVYNLETVFIGSHIPPRVVGSIDRIHTVGFSQKKKYYYRLIIQLEKQFNFHYQISQTHFTTDLGYRSRTGTSAIIDGESIQACYIHNDKEEHFLSIDSSTKQTFDEFAKKANAITIGMAYLSGFYAGNQGYFFAYNNKAMMQPKHFRCVAMRNSINSGYTPICSNPYSYLSHRKPLAEKYYSLLRTVSLNEFSLLCQQIFHSLDLSSALMLILESSVASLLFMPGGYAIALETISDIVIEKKKLKLAPIKDKALSKKIREEFIEILNNNSATIEVSDKEALLKRIDQFNQPTNKARLKVPFYLLDIDLLDEDLKILETRNDFLHGRVPDLMNAGPKRSTERINKDLYYCSIRFYTLLNMIILKWIGYDNRVVNYPKIHEGFTQIRLKEDFFRQIVIKKKKISSK